MSNSDNPEFDSDKYDSEEYDSDEYPELHPNLEALTEAATSQLHQQIVSPGWRRLTRGLSHEIYVAKTSSELRLVARLSRTQEDIRKLESEVATMRYVKQRTRIPIPTVYVVETTTDNPVGMQYVIMERMPGAHLYDIWDELSIEHQKSVLTDIADILTQLAALKFDRIGALMSENGDMGPIHSSVLTADDVYSSSEKYLDAFVERMGKQLEPTEQLSNQLKNVLDILHAYCSTHARRPYLQPPFRLIHGDFDAQNILYIPSQSGDSPPTLSGVIDWENSFTGPLYFLIEYPIFIQDVHWSKEFYARNAILRAHFIRMLAAADSRIGAGTYIRDWFPHEKSSTLNRFREIFMTGFDYVDTKMVESIIEGYLSEEQKGTGKPYTGRIDWTPDPPVWDDQKT
ncbi:hypothetical protein VNI00_003136 [Paramarasmius palmivorus]|uniref:Aminoglycoside phosphotransferase domain-containing protein n=1 Tax=Paramarasmius palmivorus TaxID=297713 RepID=A0AAW0DPV9_9AGAR